MGTHLEHTAGLLIDQATDALDTTTAREAADGGLGDALDVVTQHLAVALGSALAQALAACMWRIVEQAMVRGQRDT